MMDQSGELTKAMVYNCRVLMDKGIELLNGTKDLRVSHDWSPCMKMAALRC